MLPVGAGPDCASAAAPQVVDVRGVRVAFLAAADLVNLDRNAGDDAPCLNVSGPECTGDCGPDRDAVHFALDEERLLAQIAAARAAADFVVLSFHWGISTTPRRCPSTRRSPSG
ncbi:MAG: CapA family protein [Myxococcota bacterium]